MNNKALTLSLVMAVLAVFFVQSYVSSIEESAKRKFGVETIVLVAKNDIKEMETINETMIQIKKIPKRFLEPASIYFEQTDEDDSVTKDIKQLAGSVAIVPIKKGEQLTYNKLTEPNIRTGLAPQVTPGRRAVAISVNEITGVAKLVKPGDRVDVLATITLSDKDKTKMVKTFLQDVIVLAVGRNVTNNVARILEQDPYGRASRIKSLTSYDGFTSVTLEVEPGQAQALALIATEGNSALSLTLRNNDDTERVGLGATLIQDVLGKDLLRLGRSPSSR